MFKKYLSFLAIFVALFSHLIFSLIFIVSAHATEGSTSPVLVVGLSGRPQSLDPFFSTDAFSQNILRISQRSLVEISEKMQVVCDLCESYQEFNAPGEYKIVMTLKKGQKFFNSKEITAQDIKKSIDYYARDTRINSIFKSAFAFIRDYKVKNDYEFEIIYASYDREHLVNLVLLKIVEVIFDSVSDKYQVIPATSYQVKVEENNIYLNSSLEGKKKKNYLFKVINDETTATLKLVNGEVDLLTHQLMPRKYSWLDKKYKDSINQYQSAGINYIYLNINHQNKYLSHQKVRQALSLLIPRHELATYKYKNTVKLATGVLSEVFEKFYAKRKVDPYNVELANQLLDEAGFHKDKNGVRFKLDLRLVPGSVNVEYVYTQAQYFKKAGIIIRPIISEWGNFYHHFQKGNFDLALSSWIGVSGPEIYKSLFLSSAVPPQGRNRGRYANPQFDQLISQLETSMDFSEHKKIYKLEQKMISEDYAYIDLWHPKIIWLARKCLHNVKIYPNGSYTTLKQIRKDC